MTESAITLNCQDGTQINAIVYPAATTQTCSTLIIAPALGVPQSFYKDFAEFCNSKGIRCLSFDYRGTYYEKPAQNSNNNHTSLADWGRQDLCAAIDYCQQWPEPLHFIGHSIGGQVVGLAANANQLSSINLVAASAPYWQRWSFPRNLLMLVNARILLPIICRRAKIFDSKKFGLGTQWIESALILNWCHWMQQSDYLFSKKFNLDISKFHSVNCPINSYAISDDSLAPARNIRSLNQNFRQATPKLIEVSPAQLGAKAIGHSGLFRKKIASAYWPTMTAPFCN